MTEQPSHIVTPASVVKQSSRQVHCRLGDVFVLMDAETGGYFELNGVGSRLWNEIASPVAIDELVNRVSGDYDVTQLQCEADILAWVGKMQTLGFIEVADVEPHPTQG